MTCRGTMHGKIVDTAMTAYDAMAAQNPKCPEAHANAAIGCATQEFRKACRESGASDGDKTKEVIAKLRDLKAKGGAMTRVDVANALHEILPV